MGCRNSQQDHDANIIITLETTSTAVGDAPLTVTLQTADGNPITDAILIAKGDMTHAGMAPVLGEASESDANGRYQIPFEWTMSGDWIVTVKATLPDGAVAEKQFDFSIE